MRSGQDRRAQREWPDVTGDAEQVPEGGVKPPDRLRPGRPYIPIESKRPPLRQFRALTKVPGKQSLEAFWDVPSALEKF
jgi:hypothetical protein